MKKEEFLHQLESKLQGLPKEDISDRLSFYEEMIEDRISEGKSEEEAINEIGTVDEIVNEIAKDTPLTKLVKEKVKPKRSLRAWEIVLLVLGFPLWFPLLIVAFVLVLVAYILIWVLVIVSYAVELSFNAAFILGLILFFYFLFTGEFSGFYLGASIMSLGASVLMFYGCYGSTKLTIKISKGIINKIKSSLVKKGGN